MRSFLFGVLLASQAALGQSRFTNIEPPAVKPPGDMIERMLLSMMIPTELDKYRFLATTKVDGRDRGVTEIDAWGFDEQGKRSRIGTVAPGTEIKIEFFKQNGRTFYYALPYDQIAATDDTGGIKPKWAWISGRNIEVVAN